MKSDEDRRRFLRDSSALLLGGAAASALAAEESPLDEVIRVAVVGTGGRGCDLIRSLSTIESVSVVAVVDIYEPHLERGARFAGDSCLRFRSAERMLETVKPDAVVVATPLATHHEISSAALLAGCDVFCEKTMCFSVEEARALVRLVAERRAVFQVGLQRRANAVYRQAKAMVDAGMLGDITSVKCQWHRNGDWRRPVPVPRGHPDHESLERQLNWRLYRASSRGLLTELASHQLDVVNWLLGRGPVRVFGSGGIDRWRDGREVFDNVSCLFEYELEPRAGGTLAAAGLEGSYTVRVSYSSIQSNAYEGASELILGTKGSLLLTQRKGLFYREKLAEDPGWSLDGRVAQDADVITSGKTLKLRNDPWAHRGAPYEIDSESDDTRDELVDFVRHVRERDPATISDVRNGLLDTATVVIADEASRSGKTLELPEDLR